MAVFDNRFPSLTLTAPDPAPGPAGTRAGTGKCEVVVFSQDAHGRLADLSETQLALLLDVWADRTTRLAATGQIHSVLAFENRGVEVGVTLHHPHGQIYAYDHVPPVQARMTAQMEAYHAQHGHPWLSDFVQAERAVGTRGIRDEGLALSVAPPFARFPYEAWVVSFLRITLPCTRTPAR